MTDNANYDKAQELWEEALQAQYAGNLDEAISLYGQSIDTCQTPEAHTYLGWAFSMRGDFASATEECHKAIALDPEFGNPYNDIGVYLIQEFRFDEAVPWLGKAINTKRYDCYHYPHYNLGTIWEYKGLWKKAEQAYVSSLAAEADYPNASAALRRVQHLMRGTKGLREFSLEEANRTLPYVSQIAGDIHMVWTELKPEHEKYFSYLRRTDQGRALPQAEKETGKEDIEEQTNILEELNDTLRAYLKELHRVGVQMASPALGTINFLHYINKKPILLSWQLGDQEMKFAHELDEHSEDRRPLDEYLEPAIS